MRFLEIDFFKKNKITPGKNTGKQEVKSSNKMNDCGWIWHLPTIPALGSLRQEVGESLRVQGQPVLLREFQQDAILKVKG